LNEELKEKLSRALDSSELNTTYVKHCPNSFGVSITNKAGWKITYSGDTMPTERLVSLG
jgi:ribonuclease Z